MDVYGEEYFKNNLIEIEIKFRKCEIGEYKNQ